MWVKVQKHGQQNPLKVSKAKILIMQQNDRCECCIIICYIIDDALTCKQYFNAVTGGFMLENASRFIRLAYILIKIYLVIISVE